MTYVISTEYTDGEAIDLRDELLDAYPLEVEPEPPVEPPVTPPVTPPSGDHDYQPFINVWGEHQDLTGRQFRTNKLWDFRTSGGIAIKTFINPGQRIQINCPETTAGRSSVPEMSISYSAGDYENFLDWGIGVAGRARVRNTGSNRVWVYINVRIQNHDAQSRPACMLKFTQL